MSKVTPDPLESCGIERFGARLRAGEVSAEDVTRAYLARIAAYDPGIGAFEFVADESALDSARAMDALLASGTDLGPLMGVPVAIKDIFAVDGMPTHAGTLLGVSDLIGGEGSFVRSLRRAGCVILGKTRTVEFALGITGVSRPRGTPWNPWDSQVQRLTGGSSSGSAAAVAAGLCAFAIGSDTGGSVRVPAALCGVAGLKTSWGLWPLDGVFPLAPHLDTIGYLARSAADIELIHHVLAEDAGADRSGTLDGLHLGLPDYCLQGLAPEVQAAFEAACATLEKNGARLTEVAVPQAAEREAYFPAVLPACLVAGLGKERYEAGHDRMDPIVGARSARGLKEPAWNVLRLEARRALAVQRAAALLRSVDAWICPSAVLTAPPVADLDDVERALEVTFRMGQNSQPMNYFGLCGATVPLPVPTGSLPVGLQVVCGAGEDAKAAGLARRIGALVGDAARPDIEPFRR